MKTFISILALLAMIVALLAFLFVALFGGVALLFWDSPAAGPYVRAAMYSYLFSLFTVPVLLALAVHAFWIKKRLRSLAYAVGAWLALCVWAYSLMVYIPGSIAAQERRERAAEVAAATAAKRDFVVAQPTKYLPYFDQFMDLSGNTITYWYSGEPGGLPAKTMLGTIQADGSAIFTDEFVSSDAAFQELLHAKNAAGQEFATVHPLAAWRMYLGYHRGTDEAAYGEFSDYGRRLVVRISIYGESKFAPSFTRKPDGTYVPDAPLSARTRAALLAITRHVANDKSGWSAGLPATPVDLSTFLDLK